jgi:predicted RNA-binding Zn ribbon-like protein
MSHVASTRYGVRVAEGSLSLVQDLLNTRAIEPYATDLLVNHASAQEWASAAVAEWAAARGVPSPTVELSWADVRLLRETRDDLYAVLAGECPPVKVGCSLTLDDDAGVQLVPAGRGARWIVSAAWSEVLLAQIAGTWPRVKRCRNEVCGSVFYDTSRNNSGAWHNTKTCGNLVNLRASRERKRSASD